MKERSLTHAAGMRMLGLPAVFSDVASVQEGDGTLFEEIPVPLQPACVGVTGDFTIVSASCSNCFDEAYFEDATYTGAYVGVWTGVPRLYRMGFGLRI